MVKHLGGPPSTSNPDPAMRDAFKNTTQLLPQALLSHLLSQRNSIAAESLPTPGLEQDEAGGNRAARAASLTIAETLRNAAQAELLRMQTLQDQQRRRSTSAAHQLPTVRAGSRLARQTPTNSPLGTPTRSGGSPQLTGHKRQWEDTVHSQQFLEQAGAVAHQFGRFFSQERAWAGMALEAAVRRSSELSASEGFSEGSRASISTAGSRASMSMLSQASGSSGPLPDRQQLTFTTAATEDTLPPLKRLRMSTSQSETSLMLPPSSSPNGKVNPIPSIVRSSPTPSSESRAAARPSEILHSVISAQRSRILPPSAAQRAVSSPNLFASPQRSGSSAGLVTVLSDFATMLEGREQVSRGLEALAREGQQLVCESGPGAQTPTGPQGVEGEGAHQNAAASPSEESEDAPLSASASEWTDSSLVDMLGVGSSSRRATICSTSSKDGDRRPSEAVDDVGSAPRARVPQEVSPAPVNAPSYPAGSGFALMKRRSRSASPGLSSKVFQSRASGTARITASSVFFSEAESVPPRPSTSLDNDEGGSPASNSSTHAADGRSSSSSNRRPIVSGWCAWRVPQSRHRSNMASRRSIAVAPHEPSPTQVEPGTGPDSSSQQDSQP